MPIWIVFFRGINVGGNNILPMKELAALLKKAGCTDVFTYIQSGNVVLKSSEKKPQSLAKQIAASIKKEFGFEPKILVMTLKELEQAISTNPFKHAEKDPKSLHCYFLSELPQKPNLEALQKVKLPGENFVLDKKVFYLHAPDGIGRSKLAAQAERLLGVDATARNWNTVCKMTELASN